MRPGESVRGGFLALIECHAWDRQGAGDGTMRGRRVLVRDQPDLGQVVWKSRRQAV